MMDGQGFKHTSVLLTECISALRIKPDGVYLDGTTGGAGHSRAILEKLGPEGRLLCLDRDEDALAAAKGNLESSASEGVWTLHHTEYSNFDVVMQEENIPCLDGCLLDLGVSSWQLDEGERGFSYMNPGPLDMRMDRSKGISAAEYLERIDQAELCRVLRDYGEEKYAGRIAARIMQYQAEHGRIQTTEELAEIIVHAQPPESRRQKGHPAKRSFQAIRIAVNGELRELETFLDKIIDYTRTGGRIAIISFHSLEDRIVKQKFRSWEQPCTCPPGLPCVCGKESLGKADPRNGILPSAEELQVNNRSHSARLRVFAKGTGAFR